MANTFEKLSFTKDWNNSADFPTYEENEAKVRADLQALHDETKNFINDKLIPGIENLAVPGSGDMLESTYDPQRKRTDVYQYADDAVAKHNTDTAVHDDIRAAIPATPEDIGACPAVESGDYPGCYYRTIDGVVEWINPPTETDIEYRTTERYLGKPVYVKLVDGGALPNNTLKYVAFIPNEELEFIVEYVPYTLGKPIMPYSPASGSTNDVWFSTSASTTHRVIKVTTNYDASTNNFSVLLKYTKTTD